MTFILRTILAALIGAAAVALGAAVAVSVDPVRGLILCVLLLVVALAIVPTVDR